MEDSYLTLEQGFLLEELLGLREMEHFQPQNHFTTTINNNGWTIDNNFTTTNINNPSIPITENSFENYSINTDPSLNTNSFYTPFCDELSPTDQLTSADSFSTGCTGQVQMSLTQNWEESYFSMLLEDESVNGMVPGFEPGQFKVEQVPEMPVAFDVGFCGPVGERKSKGVKKVSGQQSKNLMAERRRRKRLNDRLSMLRSVVPKISKVIFYLFVTNTDYCISISPN